MFSISSVFYYFTLLGTAYFFARLVLSYVTQYFRILFVRTSTQQLIEFYKNHDFYAVRTDSKAPIQGAPITNMGYWRDIRKPNTALSFLVDASKLLRIANLALFDLTYDTAQISSKDSLVVDVGCAFGIGTFRLARKYQPKMVYGVSISPVEVLLIWTRFPFPFREKRQNN